MTKFYTVIALVILSISFSAAQSEKDAVRAAFDSYKSSIMNDQGKEAVKYVDAKTINYFSQIAQYALTADSVEVDAMDVFDKMMVLLVRYRTPKDKLKTLDGEKLLEYSIQEGMVGKSSVQSNDIGDIEISGDHATGQVVTQGTAVPYYFELHKEDGQWKVDITSLFEMGSFAIESMVKQSGMTENELINSMLDMLEGVIPASEVWKVSGE